MYTVEYEGIDPTELTSDETTYGVYMCAMETYYSYYEE